MVSAFITLWKAHLRESVEPLRESVQVGLDTGYMEFRAYEADLYCTALLYLGLGRNKIAATDLGEARYRYARWGAHVGGAREGHSVRVGDRSWSATPQ